MWMWLKGIVRSLRGGMVKSDVCVCVCTKTVGKLVDH